MSREGELPYIFLNLNPANGTGCYPTGIDWLFRSMRSWCRVCEGYTWYWKTSPLMLFKGHYSFWPLLVWTYIQKTELFVIESLFHCIPKWLKYQTTHLTFVYSPQDIQGDAMQMNVSFFPSSVQIQVCSLIEIQACEGIFQQRWVPS